MWNQGTKFKCDTCSFCRWSCWWGKMKLTWRNNIMECGPLIGYYPRADKSWLVVKELTSSWRDSNVNVTIEWHGYLGDFVSSTNRETDYVWTKVDFWIKQVCTLAYIAKSEPQAAYAAFVAGFTVNWPILSGQYQIWDPYSTNYR